MALGKPEKRDLFVSGRLNTQPQQGIFLTCPACVDIILVSAKFSCFGDREVKCCFLHGDTERPKELHFTCPGQSKPLCICCCRLDRKGQEKGSLSWQEMWTLWASFRGVTQQRFTEDFCSANGDKSGVWNCEQQRKAWGRHAWVFKLWGTSYKWNNSLV